MKATSRPAFVLLFAAFISCEREVPSESDHERLLREGGHFYEQPYAPADTVRVGPLPNFSDSDKVYIVPAE